MKLLAYCTNCNKIFLSRLVGDTSPSSTFTENQESCPECGKTAQTSNYISNTMYVADHSFQTTSDAETLKNILHILQKN
jgi:predicted  nucleic acid-binding Zn ribbon protein